VRGGEGLVQIHVHDIESGITRPELPKMALRLAPS